MSPEPYQYIDSDGDRMHIHAAGTSIYVEVMDRARSVTAAVSVPADERQAAAQAMAGDEYRVVPAGETADVARDQRDRLIADVGRILDALGLTGSVTVDSPHNLVERDVLPAIDRLKREHAAGEYGPAAIARAKADALHAFADTMDRLPDDWVLIRRDYGSEVTVEDLLRQTADRYVEQPYPILTQIRVDPKQPDRPEPVDPASVRVWDVVEVEGDDWMVRGPVVDVDDPNADGPRYSPDRPVGIRFGPHMAWPNVSDATVRVLHAAEPEPDPDAVEAMEVALANVGIYAPHDAALRLIRDHGVRVEVPDAD